MHVETDVSVEWKAGKIVVGTTQVSLGSIAELSGFRAARGIQLKSNIGNTTGQRIVIGEADVNTTDDNGYPLAPGDAIFLPLRDLGKIYLIASAASQTIHYVAL